MAILMVLSFAVSMLAMPNANAQTYTPTKTYPFVDAVPMIAGVGQPVLINWGLLNFIGTTNDGFNATVVITHPNGKVEEITAKTWSTGSIGRKLSFSEPGNYTLQCVYKEENATFRTSATGAWQYRQFLASESENVTLQIIEGYWKADYPGHSPPSEYWTRPVDAQLREWWSIMGSWVVKPLNLYAPHNAAPESAHVLWSMPIGDTMGGLAGGDNWEIPFQGGDAYEGKFADSVIIAGVLYFNRYPSTMSGASYKQTVVAVDLHTGKVLWEQDFNTGLTGTSVTSGRITRGQILTFINENNRGAWAYLWFTNGTTMHAIDPITGVLRYSMTGVPSGTIYIGPSGELLKYSVTNVGTTSAPSYVVRQWNSTYIVMRGVNLDVGGTGDAWGPRTTNRQSYNAAFYDQEVAIPGMTIAPGTLIAAFPGDRLVYSTTASATNGIFLTGISLDPENFGFMLFNRREFKAPDEWEGMTLGGIGQAGWAAVSQEDYRAVFWTKENRVNYVFNLETGRLAWQSEPQIFADAWSDTVTSFGPEKIFAYGKLYEASVGGIVYCYDAKDGELLWTYEATDKYNESYHRENWWLVPLFISDGKIYLGHMVHSPQVPISRGAPFLALDAETGEIVWEINGAFRQTRWGGRAIIGDSIIATYDYYDQQIYAIGKGPSELTVSAPNIAVTADTTALITGTVMDVSPGTQSDNLRLRFPNGVPAVGDESQSEWMLYLYKQFSAPMDVTGIEITVYAYDGENVIPIGTTESDARGQYAITWKPDREGTYEIWAYFEGTASFYGNDAKTTMAVSAAPEVVEPEPTPPYEWYIVGMGIAIIAVVLIIGLLILKKK